VQLSLHDFDNRIRNWSTIQVREHALRLIDILLRLASETDPKLNEKSTSGKDQKAWSALVYVNELSKTLGGWALHHQIGLALKKLQHVGPALSPEMASDPEFADYKSQLDSHEHEISGRNASLETIDAATARAMLINCLAPNPGGLDLSLKDDLVNSLKALEYGETLELLRPGQDPYQKVRWQELQHQLRATELIEYRCRRGNKKYAAQEEVAGAYGVSKETIRGWESAVRRDLGELAVMAALEGARNAAIFEREALEGARDSAATFARETRNEYPAVTGAGYWDRSYGSDALERASQEYKAFKRRHAQTATGR
jgi:hypothetical protein